METKIAILKNENQDTINKFMKGKKIISVQYIPETYNHYVSYCIVLYSEES